MSGTFYFAQQGTGMLHRTYCHAFIHSKSGILLCDGYNYSLVVFVCTAKSSSLYRGQFITSREDIEVCYM